MNRNDEIAFCVQQAKEEITADIAAGTVPATVSSFAELHDHVDANEYGGAAESWHEGATESDAYFAFWSAVQNAVDAWLKAGRPC